MKRHISIFALLLSAFVAGVARQAVADEVVVISDRSDLSVTDISFYYDSQSSYYWGRNTLPSDLTLSSVPSGYRFRGWYTMAGNDDTREGEGTSPTKCTRLLTDDQTITAAKISDAATSAYWSERGTGYVVCPQFVKTYRISTAVSPAGAGSVSGDGTVDDGGSVTLEAKANTGYVFSQWSDGSTTNPRTISDIKADATYTAEFRRLSVDKPKVTTDFTYDGTQKICATEGSHYTVTGNKGTNAGDYTFTAKLESGYTWSDDGMSSDYEVKWKINPATIESVTLATVSATYDGKPHQPAVNSVTASGKGFSSASAGWTVAYTRGGAATTDFTKAGTITVTVTGKDGLSGTASATFTIAKKTISTTGVGFSDKSVTYDGTPKSITASSIPEGVKATYSNNSRTDAGSQKTTVNFEPTDTENCTVSPTSKTATLTVNPATITGVTLASTSVTYDGQPHQPQVVSVMANGKTFTDAATGWNVTYDNTDFTSVGNIQVTANGKNNLTGSANAAFEIKSKSITVTFDPNGGNAPSPASKTVQYPGTYGTLPTCTRKGYDLKGWWTAKEGGTQITETTSVESTASQTLFAHWKAKRYTLTIALKEGESYGVYKGPQNYQLPDPLIFGETNLNEIAVAYKKDDADFQGYFTSAGAMVYDAQGRNVMGALGEYWTNNYPVGTYCYDGNLTLSARFADPREHYEVTVTASPAEAGTVDPSGTATYVEGSNIVLTATENTGYSFWHWTKNGAEVSTAKEYPITVNANAEYVAVFTGKVYTVTFDGQRFFKDLKTKQVSYGQPYGDEPEGFVMDGYKIEGWYTLPYGQGVKKDLAGNVDTPGDHTLYANWVERTEFDVVWRDLEGGNTWVTNRDVAVTTSIGKADPQTASWPAKRDNKYWIKKWNPTLPLTVEGDTTITAVWESYSDVLDCPDLEFDVRANWVPDTTPRFYKEGDSCLKLSGTGGDDFVSVKVTEPGEFTFNWKAGSKTTALYVNEPGSGLQPHYVTSIDQWTPVTIQVTAASKETPAEIMFQPSKQDFDSYLALDAVTWTSGIVPQKHTIDVVAGEHGGVAKSPVKDEYDEGDSVTLTATADTGYAFCCWTNDTGFATNANPWTFKVVDDVAYTATFTNCQYVVTLDPNGGTGGETSVLVTYDTDLPKIDVLPHKDDGSSFLGYFDQKTNGTQYYSNEGTGLRKWDKPNAATLYAQWKAPDMFTLTVTDDGHGTATKEPNQSQYVSGSKVALTATANEGYAFEKWSDGSIEIIREVTVMSNVSYAASFTNIPVVVIDPIARALDCEDSGLTFEVTGGWSVFTNESFAQEGPSCLSNKVNSSTLTTTITESGTLTFWWKAKYNNTLNFLCTTNNKLAIQFTMRSQDLEMWRSAELPINASQGDVTLVFRAQNSGSYTALDHFTWTPEGKEPEYADTDTPVTGFSMADGKVGFSFVGDGRTYHLLGTNDLIAPMPWPMVFETNKASGTILFDIPVKADEPKMFYRIRALE